MGSTSAPAKGKVFVVAYHFDLPGVQVVEELVPPVHGGVVVEVLHNESISLRLSHLDSSQLSRKKASRRERPFQLPRRSNARVCSALRVRESIPQRSTRMNTRCDALCFVPLLRLLLQPFDDLRSTFVLFFQTSSISISEIFSVALKSTTSGEGQSRHLKSELSQPWI